MLYATVRQRKIHVKNPTTVIRNGVGVDTLILDMDDEWQEMTSIVCVFQNGQTAKEVRHTFGTPVTVPWECLTETGRLSLSCTGYVGEEKVMTTMLPDSFWTVAENGAVSGDTPLEPTPNLYGQVLAAADSANAAAAAAAAAAAELQTARANGEFDGAPGEKGEPGEPGKDGVTPVVGVDYWTQADKAAVVQDVLAALPVYDGEVI